ncbi:hypothetical protein BEN47_08110 [Hymenobacter lapidarius]|uniref:Uncharacterized protein n=2 Tax=Hymenobacter lapidarius TaxID=1908237 RepID=A0A1G1TE11_9BACT|nr:hypothetical protein BEN47_08110 [Hymenobacter lapidarius]
MIQGMPGSQFALFVQNKQPATASTVRSVSFFIDKNGSPTQPFRVHLYKADGDENKPGSDLLTQSVVAAATQGGKWFTVDVASYNISVPQEGLFVAMEWITDAKHPSSTDATEDFMPYGQILRPTFEFKESRTWTYTIGNGWNLLQLPNGQGRSYNAMIKAEVDIIK